MNGSVMNEWQRQNKVSLSSLNGAWRDGIKSSVPVGNFENRQKASAKFPSKTDS